MGFLIIIFLQVQLDVLLQYQQKQIKMEQKWVLMAFLLSATSCRLMYGFAMIRHGVKYPYHDNLAPSLTAPFQNQLTPTGLRQLYNLGSYFRENYVHQQAFLPQQFDGTIQIFSSSLNRTQMSAYAFIYGLYPLQQGVKVPLETPIKLLPPPYQPLFSNHLITEPGHPGFALRQGFSPIPIHPLDYILESCGNYKSLQTRKLTQMAEWNARLYDQNVALIQRMYLLFNVTKSNQSKVYEMQSLYRTIEADRAIGITIPANYTEEDNAGLKSIYDQYTAQFNSGKFGRILTTLQSQFIRDKLVQGTSGKTNKKMVILSSHSSDMWPILVSLNLTSSACISQKRKGSAIPDNRNCEALYYASNLVLQVHVDDLTLQKFVKLKFDGKQMKMCESNQFACPLQEFLLRLKRAEQDYEAQCGARAPKGFITQIKI